MNSKLAKRILKKVESDYNVIAKEWNEKRPFLILGKKIARQHVKNRQKILDAGCGNAVLYDTLAVRSIDYVGLDVSAKLLKIAQKRIKNLKKTGRVKFIKGDVTKLPFKEKSFDVVFALAVLHHIPSDELRRKAVKEIWRVLRPAGQAIITVWNMASNYAEAKFQVSEQLKNPPVGWDRGDVSIPWKATPGKKIQRYIYFFLKKELVALFKNNGFKNIKCSYDKDGCFVKSPKEGAGLFLTAIKK